MWVCHSSVSVDSWFPRERLFFHQLRWLPLPKPVLLASPRVHQSRSKNPDNATDLKGPGMWCVLKTTLVTMETI